MGPKSWTIHAAETRTRQGREPTNLPDRAAVSIERRMTPRPRLDSLLERAVGSFHGSGGLCGAGLPA